MHEYIVKYHGRVKVVYFIALVAAIISGAVVYFCNSFSQWANMSIIPPSGLVVFCAVYFLFDQYVWKFDILYKLGVIKIPNLHGKWKVIIQPKEGTDIPAELDVHQTYSKIVLRLVTQTSESESRMATLDTKTPGVYKLRWEYFAEPRNGAAGNAYRHYGVTGCTFQNSDGCFDGEHEGYYYTEPKRNSAGKMLLRRAVS